jgi:hypothetical protein
VAIVIATMAALAGLLAGIVLVRPASGTATHAEGACIAMDLAMAYGFLDETKRKIVTRGLTLENNPYAGRFPGGYRALTATCVDVANNRWRD